MARPRISDTDRAERVREWSRQASNRRRLKLEQSGKQQLLCWIPSDLRAQLDAAAAQRNQNLSEVTTALLSAALSQSAAPSPAPAPSPARPELVAPEPAPPLKRSGTKRYPPTLAGLPRDLFTEVLMRYVNGATESAIASELNLPIEAVERVIAHGRKSGRQPEAQS